jgi:hypothetical protein
MRDLRRALVGVLLVIGVGACSGASFTGPDAGGSGSASGAGGGAGSSSSGAGPSGTASGASSAGATSGGSESGGSGSGAVSGSASGSAASGASSGGAGTGASSGGAGTGASSGSTTCPAAGDSVTFEMSVASTVNATYCYGYCTGVFVTVRDPSGAVVAISQPCVTDCNACRPIACSALCRAPSPLTTTPAQIVWDGSDWVGSTCGANVSCDHNTCAPAGPYVATMCASLGTASAGLACAAASQNTTCKDFPFDWPPAGGSTTVSWIIGEGDAGPPDDAGGKRACGSGAACPAGMVCGFPATPACAPVGECFPAPGVTCNAFSPGCACDGTEINTACNGLPSGYETQPLRHTGACVDGG